MDWKLHIGYACVFVVSFTVHYVIKTYKLNLKNKGSYSEVFNEFNIGESGLLFTDT